MVWTSLDRRARDLEAPSSSLSPAGGPAEEGCVLSTKRRTLYVAKFQLPQRFLDGVRRGNARVLSSLPVPLIGVRP